MKVLKKTADYTVYQKRSGRFAVQGADKKTINGEAKVAILLAEGYVKQAEPKAPEAPAEVVEEATDVATEVAAEAEEAAGEGEPEAPAAE
ncbi:hypothetical protein [Porticoccus sp.]